MAAAIEYGYGNRHLLGLLIVMGIATFAMLVLWLLLRRPYVMPDWLREENERVS